MTGPRAPASPAAAAGSPPPRRRRKPGAAGRAGSRRRASGPAPRPSPAGPPRAPASAARNRAAPRRDWHAWRSAAAWPWCGSGPLHVLADGREQLIAREWLGQVLLGADDPAARLVEQAVLGGQHDDRRLLEHLVVLDQRAGLVAVQARHQDVDEDDLRLVIGDLGEGLEPVGGRHDIAALLLQEGLGGAADGL